MRQARVHGFAMSDPSDVSMLAAAIRAGRIDPASIVCVIVKTEGNGLDNDWTRVMAIEALERLLRGCGVQPSVDRMSIIVSGGCEGVTTPHMVVFERSQWSGVGDGGPALAIGHATTPVLAPEAVGTLEQVRAVRDAVRSAMQDAGLSAAEVEYVQVKAPWLSAPHQASARSRGARLKARDAHGSKPWTRAACALGVAVALEEIDPDLVTEAAINADHGLYSNRASVTAGNDTLQCEVVVFGMGAGWAGGMRVAHGVLQDLLDAGAVRDTLARAGLEPEVVQLSPAQRRQLRTVLFKGDPDRSDRLRGERQVMWHDSDVHALRHLRAVMSGVIGAVTGSTRVFVSAGAEHQGPPGGGVVAVFAGPPEPAG